ncbi:MAG: hydrogenase maturation nickel metallochaperone HypA [Oscillospiraceae bacterium]|nr:hydrogenase maturation nickel metallochaperone HypA [Oscillospiraceae bacterium]
MHELGICDALLKMVRNIAKEEELEEISRITVEIGTLSGVVPAYMADCWVAVTDGTELQDVEFVIEELEGTARCLDCGEEFVADVNRLRCPKCSGEKLTPLTGRDLTLKEILAT